MVAASTAKIESRRNRFIMVRRQAAEYAPVQFDRTLAEW
jgi:hypothetical protein